MGQRRLRNAAALLLAFAASAGKNKHRHFHAGRASGTTTVYKFLYVPPSPLSTPFPSLQPTPFPSSQPTSLPSIPPTTPLLQDRFNTEDYGDSGQIALGAGFAGDSNTAREPNDFMVPSSDVAAPSKQHQPSHSKGIQLSIAGIAGVALGVAVLAFCVLLLTWYVR
jgi:hypothetical protein